MDAREYQRKWRAEHPDKVREYSRRWRDGHPEQVRASREAGKERQLGYKRRHKQRHLELVREADRMAAQARRARLRVEDPEGYRERRRQAGRKWRQEHPERAKELSRQQYMRHREQRAASIRAYRQAHPQWLLEMSKRAHARRRARVVGNGWEPYDRQQIYDRDQGHCHICHRRVVRSSFEIDHVIAIVDGGPDAPWNVAVAHPGCNRRKGRNSTPMQLRWVS